jgi:signal peptidase II
MQERRARSSESAKLRVLLFVGIVAVPADQLGKLAVEATLEPWDRVAVIPGFLYVTHTRNAGAAFGLFESAPPELRLAAFIAVSIAALAIMAVLFRRTAPRESGQLLGLSLVSMGALGNFIDRVWRGEVVDILHVRLWTGYAWPDFNVADVCILAGVAVLIIDLLSREALQRALPPR